jgi:hypothetical protein
LLEPRKEENRDQETSAPLPETGDRLQDPPQSRARPTGSPPFSKAQITGHAIVASNSSQYISLSSTHKAQKLLFPNLSFPGLPSGLRSALVCAGLLSFSLSLSLSLSVSVLCCALSVLCSPPSLPVALLPPSLLLPPSPSSAGASFNVELSPSATRAKGKISRDRRRFKVL